MSGSSSWFIIDGVRQSCQVCSVQLFHKLSTVGDKEYWACNGCGTEYEAERPTPESTESEIHMTNIYEKIAAISADMPRLAKNGDLEMGGKKVKFLAIDDILDKLNPILANHKVVILPSLVEAITETRHAQEPPIEVKPEMWSGRIAKKSTREKVIYDYLLVDVESPDSSVTVRFSGEAEDGQDKASGKASTACYKNMLIKTFNLITGDPEIEDGVPDEEGDKAPKQTRGQQMTGKARPGAKATTPPANDGLTPSQRRAAAAQARKEASAAERADEAESAPEQPAEPAAEPTPEPAAEPAAEKPSVTTNPRPNSRPAVDPNEDPLALAKAALRDANAQAGLSREEVDGLAFKLFEKSRPEWIKSAAKIKQLAAAIAQGEMA